MIYYHPDHTGSRVLKTVVKNGCSLIVSGHFDRRVCAQVEDIYDSSETLIAGDVLTAHPDLTEFNAEYGTNYRMHIQKQKDKTHTVYISSDQLEMVVPCSLNVAQFRSLCREFLADAV